ncbi:MAG: DUF5399 family protein [Chlamydiia bacterium]
MRPKPVTIDSMDLKVHQQYAQAQSELDQIFLRESQLTAPHSEIAGTSPIFSSKWEELFDLDKRGTTWAFFAPPPSYFSQSNRFFSHRLLPDLYWVDEEDQEKKKNQEPSLTALLKQKQKKRASKKELTHLTALLNKDTDTTMVEFQQELKIVFALIDSIECINEMLLHVQGRKLQYQKS